MRLQPQFVGALAALILAVPARASVMISTVPTENMNCAGGVCTPTASEAVLNVSDLSGMLANDDVTVKGTSSNSDIEIDAKLSWSSSDRLTLDAYRSITVNKPVVVKGAGSLTVTSNDGGKNGEFLFQASGHIEFRDLASSFIENGKTYILLRDLPHLIRATHIDRSGAFALAKTYDASQDGSYRISPIPQKFRGAFEGLGNSISSLAISPGATGANIGLFSFIDSSGSVSNLRLTKINIFALSSASAGGVAGHNQGQLLDDVVSGTVSGDGTGYTGGLVGDNKGQVSYSSSSADMTGSDYAYIGGLVGYNQGSVMFASASGTVSTGRMGKAGGLVGYSPGSVSNSFATGSVSGGDSSYVGGLVGWSGDELDHCYATGSVTGGSTSWIGGLVGANYSNVGQCYSTGAVQGSKAQYVGGLMGYDSNLNTMFNSLYWDLDSSGINDPAQGVGNIQNDKNITGLTTEQFLSGLPVGFDRKIWAESSSINNGYPYLIANPPPQ